MDRTDDADELLVLDDDTDEVTERDTKPLFDTIPDLVPDTEADLVLLTDTDPVVVTEAVDVFELVTDPDPLGLDDCDAVALGLRLIIAVFVDLILSEVDPDSDLVIPPVTE